MFEFIFYGANFCLMVFLIYRARLAYLQELEEQDRLFLRDLQTAIPQERVVSQDEIDLQEAWKEVEAIAPGLTK